MATRQTTPVAQTTTITDPGADEWRTPVSDGLTIQQATEQTEELAIGEKIKLLLAQSAQEKVYLKLYRVDPKSRILPWCCDYTVEEWAQGDLEMVRVNWGPGQYELRIIGSQGTIGKPRFQIAQPFAMTNPIQQPVAQQSNNDNVIAQALQSIAQMIMQGQQQTAELIRTLAPQPKDEVKELEKLVLMKKIFGNDSPPPQQNNSLSAITEIMAAMKAMKEFSGELNPAPAVDPESPMSMLPSLLDTIKSFAGKGQPAQQAQEIQHLQIPQSFEQPAPNPNPQPNPGDMILKGATQKIIELASKNADPKEGGQFIFEGLPDELLPYLAYPNWFEILSTFAPELKPHQAWIVQAKAHADTLFAAQNQG